MKKIMLLLLISASFTLSAQELMEHDFDANLTLQIPEDSEEAELPGQYYVKSAIGPDVMVILRLDKKATAGESFYKGVRDGALNAGKGQLVSESHTQIDGIAGFSFSFSAVVEGQAKLIDNYVIVHNGRPYTIQFMSGAKPSDSFLTIKKKILDSVDFK